MTANLQQKQLMMYQKLTKFIAATSSLIQTFLFKLLDLSFLSLKPVVSEGRDKFHIAVRQKLLHQNIHFTEYCIDDLGYSGENKIGEFHCKHADAQREDSSAGMMSTSYDMNVENMNMFSQGSTAHIVFIENYTSKVQTPPQLSKHESDSSLKTEFSDFIKPVKVPTNKEKPKVEPMVLKPRAIPDLFSSQMTVDDSKDTEKNSPSDLDKEETMDEAGRSEGEFIPDVLTDRVPELELPVDISDLSGPADVRITPGAIPESPRPDTSKGALHLVVFVHGYEGSSFDMKLLKNMFCFVAKSHLVFHSAIANETDSAENISVQGVKLAAEVSDLIKFNFKPGELRA